MRKPSERTAECAGFEALGARPQGSPEWALFALILSLGLTEAAERLGVDGEAARVWVLSGRVGEEHARKVLDALATVDARALRTARLAARHKRRYRLTDERLATVSALPSRAAGRLLGVSHQTVTRARRRLAA